jgi:hypothetical protein
MIYLFKMDEILANIQFFINYRRFLGGLVSKNPCDIPSPKKKVHLSAVHEKKAEIVSNTNWYRKKFDVMLTSHFKN